MTFVVDANVVAALALSRRIDVLDRHHALAPALMWSEGVSAIHQVRWRGDIDARAEQEALASLLHAHVARRSSDAMYRLASDIAASLGWAKTYDAEYVALARLERVPFLTSDGRLRRRVEGIVDLVDPSGILA